MNGVEAGYDILTQALVNSYLNETDFYKELDALGGWTQVGAQRGISALTSLGISLVQAGVTGENIDWFGSSRRRWNRIL